jgi:hypothetical protein
MAPLVIGDSGATEQAQKRRWSQERGWQTVRTWVGPVAAIRTLVPSLTSSADEVEVTESSPAEVVAYFGDDGVSGDPVVSEELELVGNDLERPLELHPWWKDNESSHPGFIKAVAQIRKDMDNPAVDVPAKDYDTAFSCSQANKYRDCILIGTTSYVAAQYVLRHTVHSGTRSSYKASMSDVNKVVSSGSLPSHAKAKFSLPPTGEWLKKAPQVQRIGLRYRITQEYWHAAKWLFTYGGTGTASTETA